MRFALFSLFFFLSQPASAADTSCLDSGPVVEQNLVWNFEQPARTDFYLPTKNDWGQYRTPAAAHIVWNSQLYISFDYVQSQQFGLFYTVHRLQIEIGENENLEVIDLDYTNGCTESGISFTPGTVLKEIPIKIPPRADGQPRGEEPIHIRVWGHL